MRIRIPGILDVVVVSDAAEMRALNDHPSIDRTISDRGGWLHGVLTRRLDSVRTAWITPDDARVLPAFAPRQDQRRQQDQMALDQDLSSRARASAPFAAADVTALARYVAGLGEDEPVGVVVQRVVGRLFDDPDYPASPRSYEAAKVVNSWLTTIDPVKRLWWKLSGRFSRSRDSLWSIARRRVDAIHATTFTIHNIVEALGRMRAMVRNGELWTETPAHATARALPAPRTLMRECVAVTTVAVGRRTLRLRAGTLIVFRLRRIHQRTDENDLAFSVGEWSQCPAHAIVPRLLECVWTAAVQESANRRYAPIRPPRRFRRFAALAAWLLTPFAPLIAAVRWTVIRFFRRLNRHLQWYELPRWLSVLRTPLGLANLWVMRNVLRTENLHDTSMLPTSGQAPLPPAGPDVMRWRTADGSFNDLRDPWMGRAGTRFGRNVPLGYAYPDPTTLLDPNPRLVSRRLLKRQDFIPAPWLNVLVAAWIQFQIHDWFSHQLDQHSMFDIPVDPEDPDWPPAAGRTIRINRTLADPTRDSDRSAGPPTFLNDVTHWWDASQLYGSDVNRQHAVRSQEDGKLRLDDRGRLPLDPQGIDLTGLNENWWVGLSLFHHLFTFEHNAICDELKRANPGWDGEQLFQTARLINAALIAKIHTLEWTPAILAHPVLKRAMRANWWGFAGEWLRRHVGRLTDSEVVSGILGSPTDHHAAPFTMTEEFVAIYRMHPLMLPDAFGFSLAIPNAPVDQRPLDELVFDKARPIVEKYDLEGVLYSLGTGMAGALALGNYSNVFRRLQLPSAGQPPVARYIDLAAVDIFRDRERGLPRYNRFRELVHLPRLRTFEELNAKWAPALREVYGDIDKVDLMVGLFAETPPPGFGFSDTAFRIFILMASRRLKSDRFFTDDYTAAVYTRIGLDWIDDNDLRSVLRRHFPRVAPAFDSVPNVFMPWRRLT